MFLSGKPPINSKSIECDKTVKDQKEKKVEMCKKSLIQIKLTIKMFSRREISLLVVENQNFQSCETCWNQRARECDREKERCMALY